MENFDARWESLRRQPRRWLITGVAGFIGSHLLETLLRLGQTVTGLDNFRTGRRANLEDVERRVGAEAWRRFHFHEADITRPPEVNAVFATGRPELVLHQAALGSVPESLADPVSTHAVNVSGFVHVLEAARAAGVERVVYASSSAVYGDAGETPAREGHEGRPLSPYGLSKALDEDYAALWSRCYGLNVVGLRYFNVFGPRQDPAGAYAAVIPRWIDALFAGRSVEIFGDGETSRDFCPVANVVEANLRAATTTMASGQEQRVFNIGLGRATTLNQLAEALRAEVGRRFAPARESAPRYGETRPGDVRHSCADIQAARSRLGFAPVQSLEGGLAETVAWFDSARPTQVGRN